MKLIIRAVGDGVMGGEGEVLAEVTLKREPAQADLDFLRAKLELTFAELHEQEVVARYDFEEQVQCPGLVFQPRVGAQFPFLPHGDGVEHVVLTPTGEAKSMLGTLLEAECMKNLDSSGK